MKHKIAVLPGDGIGPEVMTQALRVLEAFEKNSTVSFEVCEGVVGGAAFEKHGEHLPAATIALCRQSDAILFGSVGGPIYESHLPKWKDCEANSILLLRKTFSFGVNLRPIKVIPALFERSPLKPNLLKDGIDILFVRELLGDVYFGEHQERGESPNRCASDSGVYTEDLCEAAITAAFKAAQSRSRKVTLVHKANVLSMSKLWVAVGREIAKKFPDCTYGEMLVDNCAMQLVINPSQFDVVVTSNLFGDILSDLGSALPGTLGLSPSATLNRDGFGLFEPAGGSAPDIAGQNIANPSAQILSVAMMLDLAFQYPQGAEAIRRAVEKTIGSGVTTKDLGGNFSTSEFTDHLLCQLS